MTQPQQLNTSANAATNAATNAVQMNQRAQEHQVQAAAKPKSSIAGTFFQYMRNAAVPALGVFAQRLNFTVNASTGALANTVANFSKTNFTEISQNFGSMIENLSELSIAPHAKAMGYAATWCTLATGINHVVAKRFPSINSWWGRTFTFATAGASIFALSKLSQEEMIVLTTQLAVTAAATTTLRTLAKLTSWQLVISSHEKNTIVSKVKAD